MDIRRIRVDNEFKYINKKTKKRVNKRIVKRIKSLRIPPNYKKVKISNKPNDKIQAIMCLAFTNDVPHTVRELDLMSKVTKYEENADTIIAYTVWSRKKGAGQKIMEEALQFAKTNGYKRIVTLSPLTPMATHYHIRNGAKLLGHNPTTQNFEYTL